MPAVRADDDEVDLVLLGEAVDLAPGRPLPELGLHGDAGAGDTAHDLLERFAGDHAELLRPVGREDEDLGGPQRRDLIGVQDGDSRAQLLREAQRVVERRVGVLLKIVSDQNVLDGLRGVHGRSLVQWPGQLLVRRVSAKSLASGGPAGAGLASKRNACASVRDVPECGSARSQAWFRPRGPSRPTPSGRRTRWSDRRPFGTGRCRPRRSSRTSRARRSSESPPSSRCEQHGEATPELARLRQGEEFGELVEGPEPATGVGRASVRRLHDPAAPAGAHDEAVRRREGHGPLGDAAGELPRVGVVAPEGPVLTQARRPKEHDDVVDPLAAKTGERLEVSARMRSGRPSEASRNSSFRYASGARGSFEDIEAPKPPSRPAPNRGSD